MSSPPLSHGDWRKVRAFIDGRAIQLRARLETNLDPAETAHVRGRLAELRELIAWGEPKQVDASALTMSVEY
jgi:hypothetical protein